MILSINQSLKIGFTFGIQYCHVSKVNKVSSGCVEMHLEEPGDVLGFSGTLFFRLWYNDDLRRRNGELQFL